MTAALGAYIAVSNVRKVTGAFERKYDFIGHISYFVFVKKRNKAQMINFSYKSISLLFNQFMLVNILSLKIRNIGFH